MKAKSQRAQPNARIVEPRSRPPRPSGQAQPSPTSWLRRRHPAGPAATPASGPATPFKFETARWSQADRIAGGATLVLFISLFLPWFSYRYIIGTYSWNGLVHGYLYLTLLICLAIFAYLVAIAGYQQLPFKLPIRHEAVILIATVVNLVLVFIGFIDKPYGVGVGWSFGAFLALIAAIVAAAPLGIPVIQAQRKSSK